MWVFPHRLPEVESVLPHKHLCEGPKEWSTRAINKKESFAQENLEKIKKERAGILWGLFSPSGKWGPLVLFLPPSEWKCLYHLFCAWFNEPLTLSHERFLLLFSLRRNIPRQFIFCFICSVAWGSVRSNQPAVSHSDDNKSRHYHFYSGSIFETEGGRGIFVRWKNNLWSFYVPLRTLENNNTPQQQAHQRLKRHRVL